MIGSVLQKAALIVAVPALVAGASASPAMAGHKYDDHKKTVKVKVCKEVKDDHEDDEDKYGKKDDKFRIHIRSDKDYESVWVRDGRCVNVYLDFKDASFRVREDYDHDYKFLYIRCGDGAYSSGYNKCKFNKHDDKVRVTVFNEPVEEDDDDEEEEEEEE